MGVSLYPTIDINNNCLFIKYESNNSYYYGINILFIINLLTQNNISSDMIQNKDILEFMNVYILQFHNDNHEIQYIDTPAIISALCINNHLYKCYTIDFNFILKIRIYLWNNYHFLYPKYINEIDKELQLTIFTKMKHNNNNIAKKNIPYLYSRTGSVENKVVLTILLCDKDKVLQSINNIKENIDSEKFMYTKKFKLWYSYFNIIDHIESSIKLLMTNAGFYFDKDDTIDNIYNMLLVFTNEYIKGIKNSIYIPYCTPAIVEAGPIYQYIHKIYNTEFTFGKYINKTDLFKIINNNTVLVLTPYKQQIDSLVKSGNIYKLYPTDTENLTNINIITVESFLTTYPNRHKSSWLETFNFYKQEVDNIMKHNAVDIFIATCGCYGVPICNYVYETYNIKSIYNGHSTNMYLGIACKGNYRTDMFIDSDLHIRYKNINKIDSGGYGGPN